jgi:RNA polymerase sigma-70 factor (ECF subfamily)
VRYTSPVGRGEPATRDERDLIRWMIEYQQGHLDAFDRLYDALEPELRAYFGCRMRDATRVEDLIQDAFLQLHRSRRTYLSGRPVRPWAFAIAKRVWMMQLRTRRRREMPEAITLDTIAEPVDPRPTGAAERAEITNALGRLSAAARRTFMFHHWLGFSFREIGARLGIAPGAAKLRSSRAAAQLRQMLDSKDQSHG